MKKILLSVFLLAGMSTFALAGSRNYTHHHHYHGHHHHNGARIGAGIALGIMGLSLGAAIAREQYRNCYWVTYREYDEYRGRWVIRDTKVCE